MFFGATYRISRLKQKYDREWLLIDPIFCKQTCSVQDGIPGVKSAMDPFGLAPPEFYGPAKPPASSPATNGSALQPPPGVEPPGVESPGVESRPDSPSISEPSSSSGLSTGVVAAVIAGVVVMFCVCCIVFVVLRRRRSGSDAIALNPTTKGEVLQHNQLDVPADAMDVHAPRKGEYSYVPMSGDARDNGTYTSGNMCTQQSAMLAAVGASKTVSSSTAWSNTFQTAVALPQGACAAMRGTCNSVREARSVQEGLEFIDDQIATIVQHGDGIVFGQYKLVAGVHQTRRGGSIHLRFRECAVPCCNETAVLVSSFLSCLGYRECAIPCCNETAILVGLQLFIIPGFLFSSYPGFHGTPLSHFPTKMDRSHWFCKFDVQITAFHGTPLSHF